MTTPLDAALAWLDVAAEALERAHDCAQRGRVEAHERFSRAYLALLAHYLQEKQWLRIEAAIRDRLAAERGERGEKAA